jgi:amidase
VIRAARDLLRTATALDIARALRARELSSEELLDAALAAHAEENPEIQAFVDVDPKGARAQARRADARLREGGVDVPMFLGVPTGIKDHEHVRGQRTRAGSRALEGIVSPIDGELAGRMRRGGFTLMGKLATSELTILPIIDDTLHPPTRNPRDRGRYAGGSSGGSAAAVAAGMLPIAPGSDGAGSIRIPAAFCGLVGFKPGRGVLFHEHATVDPIEISAVGPIARTVRDAAALVDVLLGYPTCIDPAPAGSYLAATERSPKRLRIKVGLVSPLTHVEPEIAAAVRRVADLCERTLGHVVDEGGPLDGSVEEFLPLMAKMVSGVPIPPFREHLLEETTRWMRATGRPFSKRDVRAQFEALARKVSDWFGDADVWILPSSPVWPPEVGKFRGLDGESVFRGVVPIGAFTAPFNVSGQPAISLPVGVSSTGLPIGVQLAGRPYFDREIVALAANVEAALATSSPVP